MFIFFFSHLNCGFDIHETQFNLLTFNFLTFSSSFGCFADFSFPPHRHRHLLSKVSEFSRLRTPVPPQTISLRHPKLTHSSRPSGHECVSSLYHCFSLGFLSFVLIASSEWSLIWLRGILQQRERGDGMPPCLFPYFLSPQTFSFFWYSKACLFCCVFSELFSLTTSNNPILLTFLQKSRALFDYDCFRRCRHQLFIRRNSHQKSKNHYTNAPLFARKEVPKALGLN